MAARKLLKVAIAITGAALFTSVALGFGVFSLATRDMVELAYGIDNDNRIIELSPTEIPTVDEADVLKRAADLVKKLHKYSTPDWKLQVEELESDFVDKKRHQNFMAALDRSQVIMTINKGVQLTWASLDGAPTIDRSANGEEWDVKVPFTWYIGGGAVVSKGAKYIAHIKLLRVPRSHNRFGLAIDEYGDEPVGG
jgi:intracellular multiplication protein IcmL